jgi:hypothetical protein
MNVSIFSTKAYKNETAFRRGKNKPNSNPNKPNLRKAKMDVNIYYTKVYENISDWTLGENKPNSNPIQTQTKPILKGMNVNFFAAGYYDSKPHSQSAKAGRIIQSSISLLLGITGRESSPKVDKITLKIYPFGIDYPIVLKEKLFTIYGKDYD